jgi:DNA-binding NtrC family response regulator
MLTLTIGKASKQNKRKSIKYAGASANDNTPTGAWNCAAIPRDLIVSELFGHEKVPSRAQRSAV